LEKRREDHYWKNGVELAFYNSFALVESDPVQKRIRVSVSGKSPVQLMAVIRSHFDHIHETLNMKKEEHVFEEIPCICKKCSQSNKPNFYKYDVVQKFKENRLPLICVKGMEQVSIERLLKGLIPPGQPGNLFDNLVTIASQVQGISKTLQPDENSRNTVVSLLLGTIGFRVKDQTLWSSSSSGKRMGELDIKIEDETGRTISIIEALNLDSWNKIYATRHIKKIHIYDCGGLKENFILVYATVNDFPALNEKYLVNLSRIVYKYPLIGKVEQMETGFNNIKAYRSRHSCNKEETVLYHILVQMG
jgi:hypothetical protein